MSRCRSVRGLLGATWYEPLQPKEERLLHEHLKICPECRREYESLGRMVSEIPSSQPEFTGDLLPALREELRRRPGRARMFGWRGFVMATSAVAVVAMLIGYGMHAPDMPSREHVTASVASPVVDAMAAASSRIEEGNYTSAYDVLRKAVREHPDDALAGEAQALVAGLAYQELYRYADAYQAYETLRTRYNDVYASSPENSERLALLAEAQEVNFASLEFLEAARRAGADGFNQLESILRRYPTQMVASLAAEEMGRIVAEEAGPSVLNQVVALERARDRCKDPVAVARLNIEVAEAYVTELHDGAQACTLFKKVLESGDPMLAQLAQETVARLGADCGA